MNPAVQTQEKQSDRAVTTAAEKLLCEALNEPDISHISKPRLVRFAAAIVSETKRLAGDMRRQRGILRTYRTELYCLLPREQLYTLIGECSDEEVEAMEMARRDHIGWRRWLGVR